MATTELEKWLWGATIAGLGTLPVSGIVPDFVKTMGLTSAFGASGALFAIDAAGGEWKRLKVAQGKMRRNMVESQLVSQYALFDAQAEMVHAQSIKDWIVGTMPVESWETWFNHYEITSIAQPEIMAARQTMGLLNPQVEPQAPGMSQVEIPGELMNQGALDATADIVLNTDWFPDWMKRSGVVCGESGDGKSFLLQFVLAQFIKEHGANCKIYIGDMDYGSSHEGSEPNTWLGLPLDSVISITHEKIFNLIKSVSAEVDKRADQTARAIAAQQPKPTFEPILLIVDELPVLASKIREMRDVEDYVNAIENVIRRGIKQNVTFKLGTQSLATGRIKLPTDLLRQIEVVMLHRAAQVSENYRNLGLRDKMADDVANEVATYPKVVNDRFVCATYLNKKLEIQGIPRLGKIQPVVMDAVRPIPEPDPEPAPESEDAKPTNSRFTPEYLAYIKSPEWQGKRKQVLERDGHLCTLCGKPAKDGDPLQVDHKRYPPKGSPIQAFIDQPLEDFQTLHQSCHKFKTQQSRR